MKANGRMLRRPGGRAVRQKLLLPGEASEEMSFEQVNAYIEYMSHTFAGEYARLQIANKRAWYELKKLFVRSR